LAPQRIAGPFSFELGPDPTASETTGQDFVTRTGGTAGMTAFADDTVGQRTGDRYS
jgi:hypothetical protein